MFYYRRYNNNGNFIVVFLMLMFFFGGFRILLGLIGLLFSLMPLIFVLGIGYFLFKNIVKTSRISDYLHTQPQAHNQFVELFSRTAAHIIVVDGKIEPVEIQTFKNFFMVAFNYRGVQLDWVEDILRAELKRRHSVSAIADEINRQLNYDVKLVLLDLLYQIALSDFEFHYSEQQFIERLVDLLHVNSDDHFRIKSRYVRQKSSDDEKAHYYKVLGLTPDATEKEIKSAYRKLVKQFHPDVVAHLGQEMKDHSEKKMQEIIEAYEAII